MDEVVITARAEHSESGKIVRGSVQISGVPPGSFVVNYELGLVTFDDGGSDPLWVQGLRGRDQTLAHERRRARRQKAP